MSIENRAFVIELARDVAMGWIDVDGATRSAGALPGTETQRLQHVWLLREAAAEIERELERQAAAARKAVGPALARGAGLETAREIGRAAAPDLPLLEIWEIADQETAWWLRWRHEHPNAA